MLYTAAASGHTNNEDGESAIGTIGDAIGTAWGMGSELFERAFKDTLSAMPGTKGAFGVLGVTGTIVGLGFGIGAILSDDGKADGREVAALVGSTFVGIGLGVLGSRLNQSQYATMVAIISDDI